MTNLHRFHNSHHFFSCGPSLCIPVSTHCTLWGGYNNHTYYVCCIEHRVCAVHQFHCLLCPTSCLQSPMSEAVSPSMEDFGEACVGYDDSGVSEASESSSAIIREQSMADSGARTLPHGESSYSISQKWAEVGVCVSLSLCVCTSGQYSHIAFSLCVCVCVCLCLCVTQATTNCQDAKDYLEMMCQDLSNELAQFDLLKEQELKQILLAYATAQLEGQEKVRVCRSACQCFCNTTERGIPAPS